MILPRLAQKLAAKRPAFGVSFRFRDPAIVEVLGAAWDYCWIDVQHGTICIEHLPDIIRACDLVGVTSLVRLPHCDPTVISFVLDMDPGGVIIAQTDTAAQAAAVVRAARFPPLGNRSYGGRRIIDRHSRDFTEKANRESLVLCQLESPEGIAAADALAAVPGLNGLMIGPDDLRLRLGVPLTGGMFDPELLAASQQMAAACHRHGKLAMGFGGKTPELVRQAVAVGFDLVICGADSVFLQQGSAAFRAAVDEYERSAKG